MIYLVGMGPGNIKYLTGEAIDCIKSADKVIAFGRISRTAEELGVNVSKVSRVAEVISLIEPEKDNAILVSGDPCFYGMSEYLKNNGIKIDAIIPGLSSFQYLMNKLQKSWHNANLMSLHGREENIEQAVKTKLSVILTDSKNNPDFISNKLYQLGVRGKIYVGSNLSYQEEEITIAQVGESVPNSGKISIVVVENEMDS